MLVAIEGIDGSGTTTQGRRLADRMKCTWMSGIGELGPEIQRRLRREKMTTREALPLLFLADRHEVCRRFVNPIMAKGRSVVITRYEMTTLVYHLGIYQRQTLEDLMAVLPKPTISIVLDVPIEETTERRRKRGDVVEFYETIGEQRRLRQRYLDEIDKQKREIREYPTGRQLDPVLVDGTGTEDEVHERIWQIIEPIKKAFPFRGAQA